MSNSRYIGFYGYPPHAIIESIQRSYPNHEWVDLDVDLGNPDSNILPVNYCRILRNIMDNAIFLKDQMDLIITSTGAEKCDGGRYISRLLMELNFNVLETKNDSITGSGSTTSFYTPISKSALPLDEKVDLIMRGVLKEPDNDYVEAAPTHGFWGVPPHDFELLKLFPNTTHVYGWTRCVEAGRPADIDLECHVDPGVPTVFFVQSFCAKSQLAKYLAEKHSGLFVDADGTIGMGLRAKIEAFLELNKAK